MRQIIIEILAFIGAFFAFCGVVTILVFTWIDSEQWRRQRVQTWSRRVRASRLLRRGAPAKECGDMARPRVHNAHPVRRWFR